MTSTFTRTARPMAGLFRVRRGLCNTWYMTVVVVTLIAMALAAFYITKISTEGKIALIAVPRERFVERWGVYVDAPDKTVPICAYGFIDDKRRTNLLMRSLAYLAECPWCQGFWWGWVLALLVPVAGLPVGLVAFALAACVGVLSEIVAWVDKTTSLASSLTKK